MFKQDDKPSKDTLQLLIEDEKPKMLKNKQILASSNLKGDYGNIAMLLFLYLLQGIPLGLIYAVPMILQKRGLSYKDQAGLSFSQWPYACEYMLTLDYFESHLNNFFILYCSENIMGTNCGCNVHKTIRSSEELVDSNTTFHWNFHAHFVTKH